MITQEVGLNKVAIHEEKMKLSRELGLSYKSRGSIESKATSVIDQVKSVDEIKRLTDMKFKLISSKQIREKLSVQYWGEGEDSNAGLIGVGGVLAVLFLFANGIIYSTGNCKLVNPVIIGLLSLCTFLALLGYKLAWVDAEIFETPLHNWDHDIPYGGLLAIKEAKDKGLNDFHIYYPAKKKELMKSDPIIVSKQAHGVMIEIFSWDEGIVYD